MEGKENIRKGNKGVSGRCRVVFVPDSTKYCEYSRRKTVGH